MAPRFKKNMYFIEEGQGIIRAMVGFISDNNIIKNIQTFRDKLIEKLSSYGNFYIRKIEGVPTPIDSWTRFLSKDDKAALKRFLCLKSPGLFASLFKTRSYISWKSEKEELSKIEKISLETSHDYPCILIDSRIHSPEQLTTIIEEAGKEMGLILYKNQDLPNIRDVVTSNKKYDILDAK